jgi:hypothetical protein
MAQFVELNLDQGTDFKLDMELTNDDGTAKNVENYAFSGSLKRSYYTTTSAAELTVTIEDAANGAVSFSIDSANTANIKAGRYVFDIKQIDDADITSRIVEGLIIVNPQVTE